MEIKIMLPIAPLTINQAFQGRRFKTKKYLRYEREIFYSLPQMPQVAGWVDVIYQYGLPPRQFGITDTGNLEKCLTDTIVKRGYIEDDRRIITLTQQKVKSPTFFIKVWIKSALLETISVL